MSWKVRHQGSPRAVENLSLAQVVEGLQDGVWDSSSEVLGPHETRWTPMERHPILEETVQEFEDSQAASAPAEDPEEQRIDMNPLIDVCLVLLVFFILATTMQVLEKVLNVPHNKKDAQAGPQPVPLEEVSKYMIQLTVRKDGGQVVYQVENRPTVESDLPRKLESMVKDTNKTELLIDAQGVDWGTIVKCIDAAGGARIKKVHFKSNTTTPIP